MGLYQASGLPGLLPYLSSGTNSTGTLVVTPPTSADAVNLGTYSLNYLSLGALDGETYTGVLTPSGTNYRLGGGGGTLTFAPSLTGSMGLVVNGPPTGGEVILTSGNNTYSGTTVVSYGTLQVGNGLTTNGSLPNTAVTDSGALVFANPSTMTFGGAIGGNGKMTKTGSGILTLTAGESYSGPTLISAGTLQLGNGSGLNAASTITDNGALAFNKSSGTLVQGVNLSTAAITGSGSVIVQSGNVTFANVANSYSGGTSITGGTLQLGLFDGSGNGSNGPTLENQGAWVPDRCRSAATAC